LFLIRKKIVLPDFLHKQNPELKYFLKEYLGKIYNNFSDYFIKHIKLFLKEYN
jgi:hypothetical protein